MTQEHYEMFDAIRGERIIARARTISDRILVNDTHRHKASQIKLRGSAYCVIDLPFKSVREKNK